MFRFRSYIVDARLVASRRTALLAAVAFFALTTAVPSFAQQSPASPSQARPRAQELEAPSSRDAQSAPSARRGPRRVQNTGGDVLTVESTAGAPSVRVTGQDETFEPVLDVPLQYGALPDVDDAVTLTLAGPMTCGDFLDTVSVATGWNIIATDLARQVPLNLWMTDLSPAQAMSVLQTYKVYYEYDEETGIVSVQTEAEYLDNRYGSIVPFEFHIRHADIADVQAMLTPLLSKRGRMIADPRSSTILVYDTEHNIDFMTEAIERTDAPQSSRAFILAHVNAEAMLESLAPMLSERGRASVDPRTNALIVTDREERLDQIAYLVDALDKPLETRTWVLDYADPESIGDKLAAIVPENMGEIVVNADVHQVSVTATPYRLATIDEHIKAWDTKRRQVQIEAYLVTVSSGAIRDLGIDWNYMGTIDGDSFGFEVGSIPSPLPGLASGQRVSFISDNLSAVLNSLDTSGDATILAHPRITVQDGQEARFENTTEVPFAQSTTNFSSTDNNNLNTVSTISFIHVGTILEVVPRISKEDTVLLDIMAEDSSFVSVQFTANNSVNEVPQKTQNRAQTQVLVDDGQTIVLGGLRTASFMDDVERVPVLGNVPVFGRLFRKTNRDHQDRELLIFLTPTLVSQGSHPEAERLAKVDEELADTRRNDERSNLGRVARKLNKNSYESSIAIGQTGGLLVDGNLISIDDLPAVLEKVTRPGSKTVQLRAHPRAPEEDVAKVIQALGKAGMKIQVDERTFPFVPNVESLNP